MEQAEAKPKSRILRFFWGFFPWLIVFIIAGYVFNLMDQVKVEKARLEEERKATVKQEIPSVRVITLELEPKRMEDSINLPATVEPFENLWVKAEVPGQVLKVLVKEGDTVETGQIMVELDDRDYISRLERIEASYELAMMDYERMSELVKKKIAAVTDLEKIDARLKDLAAQQKEAKLSLNRTAIRAPIRGKLNAISAKVGDRLAVDKPVVQILQFDKVKVIVGVPESDVAAIYELQEADIIIEALGKRRVKGKKLFLSSQPRTLAMLYDLELVVQNPDGQILPGMFARVELVRKVIQQALVIPLYAVISQGDESYVYVEKDNRTEKRSVELGILSGWQIQVKSGLEPGDRVIVVGHRLLDNGQEVDVIKNVKNIAEILKS